MEDHLSKLDKRLLSAARRAGALADKRGVRLYLVGGIVRDILLKKQSLDLDMVAEPIIFPSSKGRNPGPVPSIGGTGTWVEADAMKFAKELSTILKARLVVYPQFKTASLSLSNGVRVDCATARKETYPVSGALPVVEPGSLKEDLFRRDFTINALAVSLNKNSFGQLIDEYGGFRDLKSRTIRILHDKSFLDDPTRILRAVRFEQRFAFSIEPKTIGLLERALKQECFCSVTAPRLFAEFKKILKEKDPVKCFTRLNQLNAMEFLAGAKQINLEVFRRLNRRDFSQDSSAWLIYCMALMESISPPKKEQVLNKFPFTREEKQSLSQAGRLKTVWAALQKKDLTKSGVYAILKPFSLDVVLYFLARAQEPMVRARIKRFLEKDSKVAVCLTGHDLKNLGVVVGKDIGLVLNELLYRKIDKGYKTKAQERQWVKKYLKAL
ncbi:MAG: hypothetical protein HQL24_01190 [Candidatus Omnitrophica bacterium]|nr:hypothetical protein [Candidatus Omnitrophota bacterium]